MKKAGYNHVLGKILFLIGLRWLGLYVFLNGLSLSDMLYYGCLLHQQSFVTHVKIIFFFFARITYLYLFNLSWLSTSLKLNIKGIVQPKMKIHNLLTLIQCQTISVHSSFKISHVPHRRMKVIQFWSDMTTLSK